MGLPDSSLLDHCVRLRVVRNVGHWIHLRCRLFLMVDYFDDTTPRYGVYRLFIGSTRLVRTELRVVNSEIGDKERILHQPLLMSVEY